MNAGWTYRESIDRDSTASLIGYEAEASDGKIGEITEESTDVGNGYVVIDTGFWILDKKRLIPAGAILSIDHDAEKVHVGMTKDEIKAAPDYVPESEIDDHDGYRDAHFDYYQPWYGI